MFRRAKPFREMHPEFCSRMEARRQAEERAVDYLFVKLDDDVVGRLKADGADGEARLNAFLREHYKLPARS